MSVAPCNCCNNIHNNINDCAPAISYWNGIQNSRILNNNIAKQYNLNNSIDNKNYLQKNAINFINNNSTQNLNCNK